MNTMKIAALGLMLLAASSNAESLDLTGKVPMDFPDGFKVGKQRIAAGSYRVAQLRPGVVAVKDERGHNVGFASLPLHTAYQSEANRMTFVRRNGEYRLNSLCAIAAGCWSAIEYQPSNDKIEIALND